MRFSPLFLASLFCLPALPQTPDGNRVTVARCMAQPPLSPEEVASAEAKLAVNPDDLNLRTRLLTHYRDTAPIPPYDDPVKRSARLQHIVYLVEHNFDVIDPASPLVYVPRYGRPYANESDHDILPPISDSFTEWRSSVWTGSPWIQTRLFLPSAPTQNSAP